MGSYLLLFAVVLGVNLLPALGPPTWSILVLFTLQSDLEPVPAILVAASAAAIGRLLLAYGFRLLGPRLPARIQRNLAAARKAIEKKRRNTILALGLFVLSPLPSAQLFEAAGLARVRLVPFTAAFFAGRTVSYSIYVFSAAGLRDTSLGETFKRSLTSPIGIALQLTMVLALVAFAWVDWEKVVGGKRSK
jgi:uncharacterized membrane protein YdjX (TVP38/TMEM64 family)